MSYKHTTQYFPNSEIIHKIIWIPKPSEHMEPSIQETETRITITATNPLPLEVSDMIYDMIDKVFETKNYPKLVFTIGFATDMDTIPPLGK